MKKAVRIEIEYEDGEIRQAINDDAAAILAHWNECEIMEHVHGRPYNGPTMQVIRPKCEPSSANS